MIEKTAFHIGVLRERQPDANHFLVKYSDRVTDLLPTQALNYAVVPNYRP